MSTPTVKAPNIRVRDCLALKYDMQIVSNDRYFAQVDYGLGLCVYVLQDGSGRCSYHAQLYPTPQAISCEQLQNFFVTFTLRLARTGGREFLDLRGVYPVVYAEDLLTLQCLLHEAEHNWRKHSCNSNTQP